MLYFSSYSFLFFSISHKFEFAGIELHIVCLSRCKIYVNHFVSSGCLHLLFLEGFE